MTLITQFLDHTLYYSFNDNEIIKYTGELISNNNNIGPEPQMIVSVLYYLKDIFI